MKLLILTALFACACADVSHIVGAGDKDAQVLRQDSNVGVEGEYNYAYETSNGIKAEESGSLKKIDAETNAEVVQGQASWQSPEGETVQLQYVADENGYQPQGSHLPTPPPIPEAILRGLEYIRAHPPPPEKN
ncbi:larval cuticle protein LCP-17-like [Plodia interpunctella]|uniref:larval cuticle protein LCP-17-like n=1 Tax=Plodia interpunctella TaxID=58824 RepID=UPI002367D3BD|nr:larval cuticle protein LCP-17-like [Plodia interpunctella]